MKGACDMSGKIFSLCFFALHALFVSFVYLVAHTYPLPLETKP